MPKKKFDKQLRALQHYELNRNMSLASRELGVGRTTLYRWKSDGDPASVTGGEDWDEYLSKKDAVTVRRQTELAATELDSEAIDFLKKSKGDLREIMAKLREDLLQGKAEPKFADYEKLLMMYMRLDNQAKDRVLWQRKFIREVLRAVVKRIGADNSALEMLKLDIAAAVENSFGELSKETNPAELPDPGDQLPQDSELQDVVEDGEYELIGDNDEEE